jgi:2-octaprenyl-6-methoxyphenol hydroxylase
MRERTTDVLIAGGGPVGAALARMLERRHVAATLVSPAVASAAARARPSAVRPIALSAPSRELLADCGLGGAVAFTPIEVIHVSQAGGFGRTRMDAAEHRLPALGWVCDFSALTHALAADVAALRTDGTVLDWSPGNEGDGMRVDVAGADGVVEAWRTRLLVVADGGATGEQTVMRAYRQAAVAALVRTSEAHRGIAWERFTSEGPLALLPFEDRYALVWSMDETRAERMLAADDRTFLAALGEAFGRRLGRFVEVTGRTSYPLVLRRSTEPATAGVVRIGNASQTLHPVAGQGLNLGLRDARVLADQVRHASRDALGTLAFAERFARSRAPDRLGVIGATDFLARVFTIDAAPLRMARGAGLALLDVLPPARRMLARRMMLGLR